MNEKRVVQWDNLKFFLIFLVVLGHICEIILYNSNGNLENIKKLRFFIYSFHMPLFLFVSGMFSKKNINNKRYYNIFYYLVIYIFMKIIFFIFNIFIDKTYSISIFEESGAPWYIFTLFIFSIITIFFKDLDKKYVFIFSIIIGCMVGYDKEISDFLCLSRIFVFYPFFYLGYILDGNKVIKFFEKKKIRIIYIIILLFSMFIVCHYINQIYWLSPLLAGRNPYYDLGKYEIYGGILRLGLYLISFILSISIMGIIFIFRKNTFFTKCGSRTLQIYVFHWLIIKILFFKGFNIQIWMKEILPNHYNFLIILIALIITMLLSFKFIEKPFLIIRKFAVPEFNNNNIK